MPEIQCDRRRPAGPAEPPRGTAANAAAEQFGFFAMLDRMRCIRRWSLMRSTQEENLAEHALMTAVVAHALAVIRNLGLAGAGAPVNAERIALRGMFHDAAEIITGDLPTPVKYFDEDLRDAYRRVEAAAEIRLMSFLPDAMRAVYRPLLGDESDMPDAAEEIRFVKAADKICAHLKCVQEVSAGNGEFVSAHRQTAEKVAALDLPECRYFMAHFADAYAATLDELNPAGPR